MSTMQQETWLFPVMAVSPHLQASILPDMSILAGSWPMTAKKSWG